jgi:hypothetical protein
MITEAVVAVALFFGVSAALGLFNVVVFAPVFSLMGKLASKRP